MTQEEIVGLMAAVIHAGDEQSAYKEGTGAAPIQSAATAWELWGYVNMGQAACEKAAKEYWEARR